MVVDNYKGIATVLIGAGFQFWMILFGFMVALIIGAVAYKAITGRDLGPDDEE